MLAAGTTLGRRSLAAAALGIPGIAELLELEAGAGAAGAPTGAT
jgi:hypothetical protein